MRNRAMVIAGLVLTAGSLLMGAASASGQTDSRYRLRQADVLEVQYRYTPEFSQTVTVGPDGYVTLQLLGSVEIGGLTIDEAHAAILERARKRLNDPEITLVVKELEKTYVTVAGYVASPGKIEIRASLTAVEAIAAAGGLREDAKHSQVLLLRRFNAEEFETRVLDLKHLMTESGVQEDVTLRPNDLLVVPQNRVSKIDRFLRVANLGSYLGTAVLLGIGR